MSIPVLILSTILTFRFTMRARDNPGMKSRYHGMNMFSNFACFGYVVYFLVKEQSVSTKMTEKYLSNLTMDQLEVMAK